MERACEVTRPLDLLPESAAYCNDTRCAEDLKHMTHSRFQRFKRLSVNSDCHGGRDEVVGAFRCRNADEGI